MSDPVSEIADPLAEYREWQKQSKLDFRLNFDAAESFEFKAAGKGLASTG